MGVSTIGRLTPAATIECLNPPLPLYHNDRHLTPCGIVNLARRPQAINDYGSLPNDIEE